VTAAGLEALLELPRPPRLTYLNHRSAFLELDPALRRRLELHFGPGVCQLPTPDPRDALPVPRLLA
jgi:hypothetical protein